MKLVHGNRLGIEMRLTRAAPSAISSLPASCNVVHNCGRRSQGSPVFRMDLRLFGTAAKSPNSRFESQGSRNVLRPLRTIDPEPLLLIRGTPFEATPVQTRCNPGR